jgi:hypothetical protein
LARCGEPDVPKGLVKVLGNPQKRLDPFREILSVSKHVVWYGARRSTFPTFRDEDFRELAGAGGSANT